MLMHQNSYPCCLLKNSPEETGMDGLGEKVADESKDKASPDEDYILCFKCFHLITSEGYRTTVHGGHTHTFANPLGIIFNLGCFDQAPGCFRTGPLSGEWTWFAGFEWGIAVCSNCLTQLGWVFVSKNRVFYGLILNRIIGGG